jgi:prophage maintenance system killer protein
VTNDNASSIWSLLDRLQLSPVERAHFLRSDPASIRATVDILIAAACYFDAHGVAEYGGRGGAVRDRRLVEQVLAAAFQTFGGLDPHPTPFDKAAMLLRGITQGHPFNDGNKRTGFLVAAYYLKAVGHSPPDAFVVEEVVGLCVRVSAGDLRDVEVIARELERLWANDVPLSRTHP